jgi:D-alanyl-D-alanine carboxypeptidase/D-alanyl-D-alanine-endopeptidase (penicillin-binding protein 4)
MTAPRAATHRERGAVALLLVLLNGCASRSAAPATPSRAPTAAVAPASGTTQLASDLKALLSTTPLDTAIVGALAQSLDTGEVLFSQNPDTFVVPASNMKIVTAAVAGMRLGWDYRYETTLESTHSPEAGALSGDLFVVGGGDPTINSRDGDRLAVFRDWATRLKAAGINRITGRLVGDDDEFEDDRFGEGWAWDDFVFSYAAPVGSLQFNENSVDVIVRPGGHVGAPALLDLQPAGGDLTLSDVDVVTAPTGSPTEISVARFPGQSGLHVRGAIAIDNAAAGARAAVDNPTRFFTSVLRDVLIDEGILVDGDAVDIDDVPDGVQLKASAVQRTILWRHQSPPLAEIVKTMMKASQNLYAETVFRTISLAPGPASVKASRDRVFETLESWGLSRDQLRIADGSGLSRMNLVNATGMVKILDVMAHDPHAATFEATLPIAGRDGTLAGRMKATLAEGNAIAKTGTMTGVRCLSGYVRTADGERIVFSFLVNNFLTPASAVDEAVDRAVDRLAGFRR